MGRPKSTGGPESSVDTKDWDPKRRSRDRGRPRPVSPPTRVPVTDAPGARRTTGQRTGGPGKGTSSRTPHVPPLSSPDFPEGGPWETGDPGPYNFDPFPATAPDVWGPSPTLGGKPSGSCGRGRRRWDGDPGSPALGLVNPPRQRPTVLGPDVPNLGWRRWRRLRHGVREVDMSSVTLSRPGLPQCLVDRLLQTRSPTRGKSRGQPQGPDDGVSVVHSPILCTNEGVTTSGARTSVPQSSRCEGGFGDRESPLGRN